MFYARFQPQLKSSSESLASLHKFRWPCQPPPVCSTRTSRRYISAASLPRLVQPTFWQSVIPKFLRKSKSPPSLERLRRSKEWNPATYFIVMFLFIGSNAIQMIASRNELANFSRKADIRIELLQDVIDRVRKGEDVDVQKLLGSGDKDKEREWENALREIENQEGRLWQSKAKKRDQKRDQKQLLEQDEQNETQKKETEPGVSFRASKTDELDSVTTSKEAEGRVAGKPAPGFY